MDSQKESPKDSLKDSLTISDIRARAVHAPLARQIRTASGSIEVSPLLLIDVHTRQGISGHAYLFGYTPLTLKPLLALLDELKPLLVGQPLVPQAAGHGLLGRAGQGRQPAGGAAAGRRGTAGAGV